MWALQYRGNTVCSTLFLFTKHQETVGVLLSSKAGHFRDFNRTPATTLSLRRLESTRCEEKDELRQLVMICVFLGFHDFMKRFGNIIELLV